MSVTGQLRLVQRLPDITSADWECQRMGRRRTTLNMSCRSHQQLHLPKAALRQPTQYDRTLTFQ